MCGPRPKKQAPPSLTTPTMQAADELGLITDGLQDQALGRAGLRTAGKGGARTPASAAAASLVAAVAGTGSQPSPEAPPADAGTELGFGTDTGKKLGGKPPFMPEVS